MTMEEKNYLVSGMHCAGCAAKVERAAESEFDGTIVNETVDQAAADLWSVIAKEYGL